jgi:hypothetical protein
LPSGRFKLLLLLLQTGLGLLEPLLLLGQLSSGHLKLLLLLL